MNMKTLMFAGVGLFAAMVPTTMWINSDMQAIQAKERAKLEAQCAQRASAAPPATQAAPQAAPSYETAPTAQAPAADDECAELQPAGAAANPATTDPNQPGADPYATAPQGGGDPYAAAPAQGSDPYAAAPAQGAVPSDSGLPPMPSGSEM